MKSCYLAFQTVSKIDNCYGTLECTEGKNKVWFFGGGGVLIVDSGAVVFARTRIHTCRVKWRHTAYGHDTIAILWITVQQLTFLTHLVVYVLQITLRRRSWRRWWYEWSLRKPADRTTGTARTRSTTRQRWSVPGTARAARIRARVTPGVHCRATPPTVDGSWPGSWAGDLKCVLLPTGRVSMFAWSVTSTGSRNTSTIVRIYYMYTAQFALDTARHNWWLYFSAKTLVLNQTSV